MWKDTMEDGIIPFGTYSTKEKELDKKQVKNWAGGYKEFSDAFVITNIDKKYDNNERNKKKEEEKDEKKIIQRYEQKSILYCKTLDCYVQVKSFNTNDEQKDTNKAIPTYECRIMKLD